MEYSETNYIWTHAGLFFTNQANKLILQISIYQDFFNKRTTPQTINIKGSNGMIIASGARNTDIIPPTSPNGIKRNIEVKANTSANIIFIGMVNMYIPTENNLMNIHTPNKIKRIAKISI